MSRDKVKLSTENLSEFVTVKRIHTKNSELSKNASAKVRSAKPKPAPKAKKKAPEDQPKLLKCPLRDRPLDRDRFAVPLLNKMSYVAPRSSTAKKSLRNIRVTDDDALEQIKELLRAKYSLLTGNKLESAKANDNMKNCDKLTKELENFYSRYRAKPKVTYKSVKEVVKSHRKRDKSDDLLSEVSSLGYPQIIQDFSARSSSAKQQGTSRPSLGFTRFTRPTRQEDETATNYKRRVRELFRGPPENSTNTVPTSLSNSCSQSSPLSSFSASSLISKDPALFKQQETTSTVKIGKPAAVAAAVAEKKTGQNPDRTKSIYEVAFESTELEKAIFKSDYLSKEFTDDRALKKANQVSFTSSEVDITGSRGLSKSESWKAAMLESAVRHKFRKVDEIPDQRQEKEFVANSKRKGRDRNLYETLNLALKNSLYTVVYE